MIKLERSVPNTDWRNLSCAAKSRAVADSTTLIRHMCRIYVLMSNITITVDRELKKKMEELKQVNWSSVAREAFEQKVREAKRKQIVSAVKAIREKDQTNWSGSEEVRKWRDARR